MSSKGGDLVGGRYRLDRLLGAGGMGAVWAATHTVTSQRRALKVVKATIDEAMRRRILREARAASAVTHPNVVTVHDVIEGPDGAPVIVMDLLEGETLGDRLEREGRLAPAEAIRIMVPVLEALSMAHALGIVHRDLKPDNIFLSDVPKILDFGVAKLTAADGPARATHLLTESGAMVGTPCYMAPEQAFADGEIDARADLWAIGVVLYECLAGVRPADGDTVGQVFKILATGAIVPIEERVGLPPALSVLVGRLLSERDLRPKDARSVIEALSAIDAPSVVDASPPLARAERTTGNATIVDVRPSTRSSWWIAAAAIFVVGAGGSFGYVQLARNRAVAAPAGIVSENANANANANADANARAHADADVHADADAGVVTAPAASAKVPGRVRPALPVKPKETAPPPPSSKLLENAPY